MNTEKSLVDQSWSCGCGALNAPWLEVCGGCNKEKENCNE